MSAPFAVKWIFALCPIVVVLVLMIGFRWGGGRAGAAAWFTSVAVAVILFGAGPRLLAFAQTKGVLLALYVLYIVWMALLLYNVVNETGAIEAIGAGIQRLTGDRVIQLLILSWVFSSFLQGVAGFGVPIAVVAPLLIGLGFPATAAVAAPAIGHSWSVTYGDIASSFQALIAVTGLPGEFLAHWSSVFLGVTTFLCGLAVAHLHGGMRSVRHALPAILVVGAVMAGTQYALAAVHLWTLAGFVAGIAGMVVSAAVVRFPLYRRAVVGDAGAPAGATAVRMTFGWALAAYVVLIVIVTVAELVGPVNEALDSIALTLNFPEVRTSLGWVVPAESGKKISVFGHPGALLLYASIASFIIYRIRGNYAPGAVSRIVSKTLASGIPTSVGIVSMVCFALTMDQSGMTFTLAEGVSKAFKGAYPLFAPAIGTLGAFMTGSNTNSNVIFGAFQQRVAELLGLSAAVILGAQTTGGSIGSMLAPAKILVGCSTVGLSGKEGPVLATTLRYGVAMTGLIGLLAIVLLLLGFS